MTWPPGDNRGVSTTGSVAPRLLVVAVLALGLVGMHHLVVAACHHAAGHSGQVSALTVPSSHDHAATSTVPVAPLQAPLDAPEAPGGLTGAAATCLAVLLMIMVLVLPHLLARMRRRWSVMRSRLRMARVTSAVLRPPDLALLSVSRT